MTAILAGSKFLMGGYTLGFFIWALMNIAAFYVSFSRVGFKNVKPIQAMRSPRPLIELRFGKDETRLGPALSFGHAGPST